MSETMDTDSRPAMRRLSTDRSSRRPATSRLDSVRASVHDLFRGESIVGRGRDQEPESPKSPARPPIARPVIGLQNLPMTRLNIPYLTRSRSDSSRRTHHSNDSQSSISPLSPHISDPPADYQPFPREPLEEPRQPVEATSPPRAHHASSRRFVGIDPAELHLAQLAHDGRRRRTKRRSRNRRNERSACAPKVKNKRIRSKILSCFISGLFLTLVLTIYLALALSNKDESQEFHVLLILIILITTIFFCHSLIRLCMMLISPPSDHDLERGLPQMIGAGGYANPPVPVQVTLARDEEAAGIESDATKTPPPAYGLWRESVRVDPNRIYWQRNEAAAARHQRSTSRSDPRPSTARPPSYISENGIDYVVEAQPRSIAPATDVPLPVHPSEAGRVWTGSTM